MSSTANKSMEKEVTLHQTFFQDSNFKKTKCSTSIHQSIRIQAREIGESSTRGRTIAHQININIIPIQVQLQETHFSKNLVQIQRFDALIFQ